MRVAAGLDSLVIGENEIQGQVKTAYETAHAAGTTGPVLSALLRHAVQAGKRVRSETEIGRAALSVATIVVEMAQEAFGSLADRTALLIGAGKMSSIAGQALVRAELRCVLVANRTFDRAERLAAALGGRAVHFDVPGREPGRSRHCHLFHRRAAPGPARRGCASRPGSQIRPPEASFQLPAPGR